MGSLSSYPRKGEENPNSISPAHYEDGQLPPPDLFDVVVVDEAHHAPATTWRAVLDHFTGARALLLTATPIRRDGRRIPGSLQYYYALRRALEEGLYKPIQPVLLTPPDPTDRAQSDAAIAARAAELLGSDEHRTSTLLVRGATVARLRELRAVYESAGIDLVLLYNAMSEQHQRAVVDGLRAGTTRAVGVVGMLSEGFDLPSLRLVAYHDKHRSAPATVQLIGRLARVDDAFPQPSSLIAVADADVFPELKGVLHQLYEEDADWAEVLPGIIDADIQRERLDREFAERLPTSRTEVDPTHLQPTKRAFVYEVPADWEPPFLTDLPPELEEGAPFVGGSVVKRDRIRDVPIPPQLLRRLERLIDGRPRERSSDHIFLAARRSARGEYEPLTDGGVYQIVKDAVARAGIEKRVYPHLLRHSWMTEQILNGMHPIQLSVIAGASIEVITQHYAHLTKDDAYDAMIRVLTARRT